MVTGKQMLFTQDRKRLRDQFFDAWQKHQQAQSLEPMEKQIVSLLEEHPEYHKLLANPDNVDKDFGPEHGEMNPFLHLSLHLALREQVGTDRPKGIASVTRSLLLKHGDGHEVEHIMIECLGECLWDAQRQQKQPDEQAYLEKLKLLL